jgi:hypothetical protein
MEQLNIETDHMAKNKLSTMISSPLRDRERPQNLPYEKVEIYWMTQSNNPLKISSCLSKTLTTKIQTKNIQRYWEKDSNSLTITNYR